MPPPIRGGGIIKILIMVLYQFVYLIVMRYTNILYSFEQHLLVVYKSHKNALNFMYERNSCQCFKCRY